MLTCFLLILNTDRGDELRGQPHLVFLPFNQDLNHLRPKTITDSELYPSLARTTDEPHWPEDDIPYIPGLNRLIDVFLVWEQVKVDMVYKTPQDTLKRAVETMQGTLDNLPPELRWQGGISRYPRGLWGNEVQMVNILITALSLKSNFLQHLDAVLPGLTHGDIVKYVSPPTSLHTNSIKPTRKQTKPLNRLLLMRKL